MSSCTPWLCPHPPAARRLPVSCWLQPPAAAAVRALWRIAIDSPRFAACNVSPLRSAARRRPGAPSPKTKTTSRANNVPYASGEARTAEGYRCDAARGGTCWVAVGTRRRLSPLSADSRRLRRRRRAAAVRARARRSECAGCFHVLIFVDQNIWDGTQRFGKPRRVIFLVPPRVVKFVVVATTRC